MPFLFRFAEARRGLTPLLALLFLIYFLVGLALGPSAIKPSTLPPFVEASASFPLGLRPHARLRSRVITFVLIFVTPLDIWFFLC